MSRLMNRARGLLLSVLSLALLAAPAIAHEYTGGGLKIGHPWARETPPAATVGAGYLKVTNTGAEADRLIAVTTPAAEKVEIHQSQTENGVARMRPVNALDIPPGAEAVLKPGGMHLMLVGLKEPLAEGMRVPATLTFEKAGRVEVEFAVEGMGYGGGAHLGSHPADQSGAHAH